jgi:hypothetical protein
MPLDEYALGVADFIIYIGHLLWHARRWGSWRIERSHGKTSLQLRLSFFESRLLSWFVYICSLLIRHRYSFSLTSKFYSVLWCSLERVCQVGTVRAQCRLVYHTAYVKGDFVGGKVRLGICQLSVLEGRFSDLSAGLLFKYFQNTIRKLSGFSSRLRQRRVRFPVVPLSILPACYRRILPRECAVITSSWSTTSTEVKNAWSFTFTPQWLFVALEQINLFALYFNCVRCVWDWQKISIKYFWF